MFLNLLYKKATIEPTIIPPNTLVWSETIPMFVVKVAINSTLDKW